MNINKYASTMSVMIKSLYLQLITRKENFMIGNVFHTVSGLQRKCIIWRNGIFWRDDNNTCTVIEFLDNNRCVMVAMSYTSTVEYAKLRGSPYSTNPSPVETTVETQDTTVVTQDTSTQPDTGYKHEPTLLERMSLADSEFYCCHCRGCSS